MKPDCEILVDSGYTGIKKIHARSKLPKKSSKKKPLTKQDKKDNQNISSERVLNENVIGFIKRFRIVNENIEIGEKGLG